jgi:hypothetical protein
MKTKPLKPKGIEMNKVTLQTAGIATSIVGTVIATACSVIGARQSMKQTSMISEAIMDAANEGKLNVTINATVADRS